VAAAAKSVYVQQQIPYTVRLYYDDTVQTGDLAAPDPANALVEQLGKEERYTTSRDGRNYNVIERRYAIAPERSGTLIIPPASFRGTAVTEQNRSADANQDDDPMTRFLRSTPLANDPFFKDRFGAGMSFGAMAQPVAARGQEIRLDVQPRPAAAQGHWLPAEQITLHDSWSDSPPQFKVGEPVTRTVTINATGIAAAQIPPLSLDQPDNARVYPEAPDNQSQTDGKTIYGISKQSVTYIPTTLGTLDVPPIELAWWNTRDNMQSRATLPAREFKVEPGTAQTQESSSPSAPASAVPAAAAAVTPSTTQPLQSVSLIEYLQNRRAWVGGAAAFLAMVIMSVIVLRRSRPLESESDPGVPLADPVPSRRSAMRALHQACVADDPHATQDALLNLARAAWADDSPRSLGALAARLEAGSTEITALDRNLYAAGESPWQGDALWRVMRHGLRPKRIKARREDDGLGALYPWKGSQS
ncbi:MAG: BatD family protein, partial [Betaproteobacteria bacterium]